MKPYVYRRRHIIRSPLVISFRQHVYHTKNSQRE